MHYFRISRFNGYSGPMFGVEFTCNHGDSWTTFSVHTSYHLADLEMRSYVTLHRNECAFW